eukprot:10227644-Lingulodinium_polyedra.AAC.1
MHAARVGIAPSSYAADGASVPRNRPRSVVGDAVGAPSPAMPSRALPSVGVPGLMAYRGWRVG